MLVREQNAIAVLCRARLANGNLHPGSTQVASCLIPEKGRVERASEFEIAVNGTPRWRSDDWAGATVVRGTGRKGRTDLYFCRAPVRVGGTEAGWAFGKAYREGPHARHCYVAYKDREIDVGSEFEVLRIEP